jgi:hypothetical protein
MDCRQDLSVTHLHSEGPRCEGLMMKILIKRSSYSSRRVIFHECICFIVTIKSFTKTNRQTKQSYGSKIVRSASAVCPSGADVHTDEHLVRRVVSLSHSALAVVEKRC